MARALLSSEAAPMKTTPSLHRAAIAAAAVLALTACGSRARFQITRPAMLDASPFGNTFEVQPFGGVDPRIGYYIQSQLQQRVTNSLNPAIRLMAGGGGVIVAGQVLDHSYREDFTSQRDTCYRSESYRDSAGRYQTRQVPYQCTRVTRHGFAHSAIRFTIMIAQSRMIVYDRVIENQDQAQTTATNGTPPGIDGSGMLGGMVDTAVESFARVILPWPDEVEVAFTDCGGGEGCDRAWQQIQAGNLPGAEQIYTQILGPYADPAAPVNPDDTDIVSDTLFNRGVVRAYSGSYELGIADIERALQVEPNHDDWRVELQNIQVLAAEQDQLRSQMQTGVPQTSGGDTGGAVQQVDPATGGVIVAPAQ
jgi:hypothetical protein